MMRIGEQPVPGYKLVSFLGEGSYGVVWKATAPGGFECALKFINLDSNSGLKEFRSINMMKRVRHSNLVQISAVWLKDPDGNILGDTGNDSTNIRMGGSKTLIIAMGLGDKTLGDRLEECRTQGCIPVKELLDYMRDAAKGIDYLNTKRHDLGDGPTAIIHCDIKPANLLLVGGGVQVCDYGVAKAISRDMRKTHAGGTVAYAPAELLNGEPSPQTDQYSLAITYFELRTGKLPFDEKRAMLAHITGNLDLSELPEDERAVIKKATSMQPAKRYGSCKEMVEDLLVGSGVSFSFGPSGVIPQNALNRRTDSHPNIAFSPPPPPPAPVRLTDRLQGGIELVPDHKLVKLLGQGAFGQVWEAENGGTSCALKIIRDLQGRGRNEFEIFRRIRTLKHPNLIQFRGYWLIAADGSRVQPDDVGKPGTPEPTTVIISTELAQMNLLQRLRECQNGGTIGIPPTELIDYIKQAADAIDYLNQRHDIQHRDIKPENLLLSEGRILVSDFGLAKLLDVDGRAAVSSSSGMTLDYAAPEVLDQKTVFPQTDQYSLAVTYCLLRTGRLPFRAGMSVTDGIKARMSGQLDLSGVTDDEQVFLRRALNPTPSLRFDNCKHLAEKLARAVTQKGTVPAVSERQKSMTEVLPDIDFSPNYEPVAKYVPPSASPPRRPVRGTMEFPPPAQAEPQIAPAHRRETEPVADARTKSDADVPLIPADVPAPRNPARKTDIPRGTDVDWRGAAVAPAAKSGPTSGKFVADEDLERLARKNKSKSGAVIGIAVGLVVLLAAAVGGAYVFLNPDNSGDSSKVKTLDEEADSLAGEIKTRVEKDDFIGAWAQLADLKKLDSAKGAVSEKLIEEAEKAAKAKALAAASTIEQERKALEAKNKKIADLEQQIEDLIAKADAKSLGEARKSIDELAKLSPEKAKPWNEKFPESKEQKIARLLKALEDALAKLPPDEAEVRKARADLDVLDPNNANYKKVDEQIEAKFKNRRVAEARALFATGKPADGLKILEDLLKPESKPNEVTKPVAEALQKAWDTAQKKASAFQPGGPEAVADYRKFFNPTPVANEFLSDQDRKDLIEYSLSLLAQRIKTFVPKLDEKTDWAKLADCCIAAQEAPKLDDATKAMIAACKLECWVELTAAKKPAFDKPAVAETSAATNGYSAYASSLATPAKPEAANALAALLGKELPEWFQGFRLSRAAASLYDAARARRLKDDAEPPYPADTAEETFGWLNHAATARRKLGTKPDPLLEPILTEALLAGWSVEESKRQKAALQSLVKEIDALPPPRMARTQKDKDRYAAISASIQGTTALDSPAGLLAFRQIFDRLQSGKSALTATNAYSQFFVVLEKSGYKPTAAADKTAFASLLVDAAKLLRRDRGLYAATQSAKDLKRLPIDLARDLFDKAFQLTTRPADAAWRGICRAESGTPDFAEMTKDLEAAKKAPDDPATHLLSGLIAVRKVRPDAKSRPDLEALVGKDGAYLAAGKAFALAIDRAKSDAEPSKRYEELALALKLAANNSILLANLDRSDRKLQAERLDAAVKYAESIQKIPGYEKDGFDSLGCALEAQSWLLRPAKWYAATGPFKKAEDAFQSAIEALKDNPSPDALRHSGRLQVKWVRDSYHERVEGKRLDQDQVATAESLLEAALNASKKDPQPAALAEIYYWKAQLLEVVREEAKTTGYKSASDSYKLALAEAQKVGGEEWLEPSLIALLQLHASEAIRVYNKNPDAAEAVIAAMSQDAETYGKGILPEIWKQQIKLYGITVKRKDPDDGSLLKPIKSLLLSVPEFDKLATQDVHLKLEMSRTLADELFAACERVYRDEKIKDKSEAHALRTESLELARKCWTEVQRNSRLSAAYRAESAAHFGKTAYFVGAWKEFLAEADFANEWKAAVDGFTFAVRACPEHREAWVWNAQLAMAHVKRLKTEKANPKTMASTYVFLSNAVREAELRLQTERTKSFAVNEDLEGIVLKSAKDYGSILELISLALQNAEIKLSEPERLIWRLAEAELTVLTAKGKPDAAAVEKANAVRKEAEAALATSSDDAFRSDAEPFLDRLKKVLAASPK